MRTYTEKELQDQDWMFKWPTFVRLSKLNWALCCFSAALMFFAILVLATGVFGTKNSAIYFGLPALLAFLAVSIALFLRMCFPRQGSGFDPREIYDRNRLLTKANGKEYTALMEHMRGVVMYRYPNGYPFGSEPYVGDAMRPCMGRWIQCHQRAELITCRPGW